MTDSVYDQALDIICSTVKTLADAVDTALIPENALVPKRFDWQDIAAYPGISIRYSDEHAEFANITHDTNAATNVAYPVFIVVHWDTGPKRDTRAKNVNTFLQSVRKTFHHKRTLGSVSFSGVWENSTTVKNGGPSAPADVNMNGAVDIITIMCWFLEDK